MVGFLAVIIKHSYPVDVVVQNEQACIWMPLNPPLPRRMLSASQAFLTLLAVIHFTCAVSVILVSALNGEFGFVQS